MVILLTGVGTRQLNRLLATRYPETAFADALGRVTVVARGPKPVAALREMGVTPTVVAPEPNTWRELLEAIRDRPERRIAIQEYGRPNPELLEAPAAARRAKPPRCASISTLCRRIANRCGKPRAAWLAAISKWLSSPPRCKSRTWRAWRPSWASKLRRWPACANV